MTMSKTYARGPIPEPCEALFRKEGLPVPPLPAAIASALRPEGELAYASPGWPGGTLADALAHWLRTPGAEGAWVGFSGHGIASTAVRLCLALPEAGFFIQRRWTEALGDGPACRLRIEGAFGLLEQALDAIEPLRASGGWPRGARLLLVDDDFDQLRWGWVPAGETSPTLLVDPLAYLSVLAAIDAAAHITPA